MEQHENPYRAPDTTSILADSLTNEMVTRGRLIFFGMIVFFVLFEIGLRFATGFEPNPIRIVGVGCLLFAIWRGRNWAIVALGLLVGLGIPSLIIATVGAFRTSQPLPIFLGLLILGSHIVLAVVLFYSKSLRAYCHYKNPKAGSDSAETYTRKAKPPSLPENPTGKELFTVAAFDYRTMADMCRLTLEQEGIKVFMADDHVIGGINFLWSNALQGIKVQVSDIDAERAVEIWHRSQAAAETSETNHYTPIDFVCEECGKDISFPGHRRGGVETCPECKQYVDVPE